MALNDYDAEYREEDVEKVERENEMPDGEYSVSIASVKHVSKDTGDAVIFELRMLGPEQYLDWRGSSMFWFSSDPNKSKYTCKSLKFLCNACGVDVVPSQFANQATREAFRGYELKVKKSTDVKGDREYVNWRYWELLAAPQAALDDGSQFDDSDIDLDKDPF
ncbi:MAG: DUF669 domain-containing protein [Aestuariibacter sp.]|nr:DUF669 domain-containing protein [Aestuariibacter sp.]